MELTRETLAYATEAEWLQARTQDLTSTEAAALFGASPYLTGYELYHRKTGALPIDDFKTNPRMVWGTRLEAAIAAGVAEDLGLIIEPLKIYARIPQLRMGSSFDFKIVGLADFFSGDEAARNMFREHGSGIMEVKNVDGLQFRRGWADEGGGVEAPAHIEMQVQHQLEVADLGWSIIAPLVGGNTPVPIIRVRDRAVGDAIKLAVAEFWNRVDHLTPPAPDFTTDGSAIARLNVFNDGSEIDMTTNSRLVELCLQRKTASDQAKNAEAIKDAATAEILTIIGAAKKVYVAGGFTISAGTTAGSTYTVERKAFRSIRISQKAA